MPQRSRRSSSPHGAPGRKAVLFCPQCGHESSVDGDWQRRARADGSVYRCPSCGVDVTVRPADRSRGEQSDSTADESVSTRAVRLVGGAVRLAVAWGTWPYLPGRGRRRRSRTR